MTTVTDAPSCLIGRQWLPARGCDVNTQPVAAPGGLDAMRLHVSGVLLRYLVTCFALRRHFHRSGSSTLSVPGLHPGEILHGSLAPPHLRSMLAFRELCRRPPVATQELAQRGAMAEELPGSVPRVGIACKFGGSLALSGAQMEANRVADRREDADQQPPGRPTRSRRRRGTAEFAKAGVGAEVGLEAVDPIRWSASRRRLAQLTDPAVVSYLVDRRRSGQRVEVVGATVQPNSTRLAPVVSLHFYFCASSRCCFPLSDF